MNKLPDLKYSRTFPRPGRLVSMMILSVFMWLGVLAFPYTVYRMFFTSEDQGQRLWAAGALGALILAVGCKALIYIKGSKIRCPLCQGASFHSARCHMNQGARKWPLLSYSTSMVIDMILYRRFVCKYCGTPFRLLK